MNLNYYDYNNYYNRIAKKFDTLEEYEPYRIGITKFREAFNTNDGVDTQILENWEYEIPNYCIASEGNQIISRWFIMDAVRTRKDQYTITLHRDVIADNFNEVIDAPCFIEKATVGDNDPAIYNPEDMSFNQIKTGEIPLKDNSGIPWIVGYYARTTGGEKPEDNRITTSLTGSITQSFPHDLEAPNKAAWEYGKFDSADKDHKNIYEEPSYGECQLQIYTNLRRGASGGVSGGRIDLTTSSANLALNLGKIDPGYEAYEGNIQGSLPHFAEYWGTQGRLQHIIVKGETAFYENIRSGNYLQKFLNLNGKVIRFTDDNTYFRIKISSRKGSYDRHPLEPGSNIFIDTKGYTNGSTDHWITKDPNERAFVLYMKMYYYNLTLEKVTYDETKYNITSNRFHLIDAPYDMFAIPYGEVNIYKNGSSIMKMTKDLAFSVAMSIGEKYAGGKVLYDIQLLPYCPLTNIIQPNGTIEIGLNEKLYSYITQGNRNVGVIFNASYCSFTTNIQLAQPIKITEKKIQNQCDMYRLVSPNYNGQFEFNAAKNNGIEFFNVDCTYLPFNPYIHVNPNFKGLYGNDFNDSRGLICGGDFSLPIVTSAWESYKLNNKNYLNAFDREIQTMELNQEYQKTMEKWKIGIGVAQGAASGAVMSGFVSGNPFVAGAGAVLGGAASLGAGLADTKWQDKLREDALDYKKDMFGFQLGNIKALPNSIAKTSAFTFNNKIFPILEYYTCTKEEKQALRDKIKYNGMTVGRIGKIRDFLQVKESYIKGKLIRIENVLEDFHYLNELANEVNKGFFIAKGGK